MIRHREPSRTIKSQMKGLKYMWLHALFWSMRSILKLKISRQIRNSSQNRIALQRLLFIRMMKTHMEDFI